MDSQSLLKSAKKHLAAADKTRDADKKHLQTIEAVILSAAAIECEVNWTICKPLLIIKPQQLQLYLKQLAAHFTRARIPEKIRFLLEVSPELELDEKEKKSLRSLFELRNIFVHSTPELVEGHYIPDDWDRWNEMIQMDKLPRKQWLSEKIDIDKLSEVPLLVEQAMRFVAQLQKLNFIGFTGSKD